MNGEQVAVGVDLGQRTDPTAFVVVEVQARDTSPGAESHYVVRLVERMPLGSSYPAVVQRLAQVHDGLRSRGCCPQFWVDATGLGQPVIELLLAAGLDVQPVYLTGSDQALRGERGELRLGKAPMVSRLQVLLQSGRIHLPDTPTAATLVQELLNYEIRVNEQAHAQFGAFRVGAHDDLATALGLACWAEPAWAPSAVIPPLDVIAMAERGAF